MTAIVEGSRITLNFKLSFDDGTPVDSNEGLEPVEFVHGDGILLAVIEDELLGKEAGDHISVTVTPEQGYGYADPNEIIDIAIEDVPEDARFAGGVMTAIDEAGEQHVVMVAEVLGDVAKVDFNHPYSGRTLCYDITITSVK
ncbi:MAG: peptidylprolyl isomerase [Moraxellaceae bacterium]|nr:MAG: peptidylprolyl isomerase [Moraxellaceae bacterium]